MSEPLFRVSETASGDRIRQLDTFVWSGDLVPVDEPLFKIVVDDWQDKDEVLGYHGPEFTASSCGCCEVARFVPYGGDDEA